MFFDYLETDKILDPALRSCFLLSLRTEMLSLPDRVEVLGVNPRARPSELLSLWHGPRPQRYISARPPVYSSSQPFLDLLTSTTFLKDSTTLK
jgi:hypothetical protein